MSFFRRPDYTSDATQFLRQLHAQNPALIAEQRAGRSRLWDQENINRESQADAARARVPQKPYVYQVKGQ
jgi:hypothetical protein